MWPAGAVWPCPMISSTCSRTPSSEMPSDSRANTLTRFLVVICLAQLAYIILVGGEGLFNFRFFLPVLPLLFPLAVLGWERLVPRRRTRYRVFGITALLTVLSSLIAIYNWEWLESPNTVRRMYQSWELAGEWLHDNTSPHTTIAVQTAGYLPYFSQRTTIDVLGLNDKHIAHLPTAMGQGVAGHEKWDVNYILEQEPDVIVLLKVDSPTPAEGLPREKTADILELIIADHDFWEHPLFAENYTLRSVQLSNGRYFNFFFYTEREEAIFR